MAPLVSVIMCTIRPVPCWKLMLDGLKLQNFDDFEFVIVDGLFDERKIAVEKILRDYSFPIVYVKDKPWFHSDQVQSGKRPGIASARNTGVINAKGRLLVIQDDNTEVPPDWLSRHVKVFEAGFDGMAGMQHRLYNAEGLRKYGEHYFVDGKQPDGRCIPCNVQNKPCNHVEQKGELTLIRDYRETYNEDYIVALDRETGESITYNILPLGWLYCGNASIRTEFVLKINGFPEEFCGEMGSEDSFMSICLQRSNAKLVLDKRSYVIHYNVESHVDFNDMFKFKNKETMLMDGKLHFSNEKYVQDLLFKEKEHFRNNPHFDLRAMRTKNLAEMPD